MAFDGSNDALFESVFDAAPLGIALLGSDGRFIRTNRVLQTMLGLDEAALRIRRCADVTHPDDVDAHAALLNELLAGSRSSYEIAIRCVHADGRIAHAQVTASLVHAGLVLAIVKDVTAEWEVRQQLRKSQDQLGIALSSVEMGFFEWDVVTDRMMWSEEMSRLAGLEAQPLAHRFGERFYLIHSSDAEQVKAAVHETLADRGRRHFEHEFRLVRPDGEVRWVLAKAHVFRDEAGSPVRALGALFDVTDRRHLQEQFFHAQKMEAIGRLASSVAHDFNNALTVIIAQSDMMRVGGLSADAMRQALADISDAAERAAHLTQQLLTFSRKGEPVAKSVDPNVTLTRLDAFLKTLATGHRLRLALTEGVGHIQIDERQLEQAIVNLVVNARDAMPVAGEITIATSRSSIGWVTIAVTDSGVGIDESAMSRLFEPFYTTKPPGRGTGLGLPVVLATVENARGEVRVNSAPGRGTTFELRFPPAP